MRRKHVVKYKPTEKKVKEFSTDELKGGLHWHCCTDCRLVYGDSCSTADKNGRCRNCTRSEFGPFMEWKLPAECCYGGLELLTDHKIRREMRLAGPGPWFHCKTCWRAHGQPLN